MPQNRQKFSGDFSSYLWAVTLRAVRKELITLHPRVRKAADRRNARRKALAGGFRTYFLLKILVRLFKPTTLDTQTANAFLAGPFQLAEARHYGRKCM